MKTLLLLRHAKSQNLTPGSTDLERPLKESGMKQAQAVGLWLKEQGLMPDLVLCSTATRARATTEIVLRAAELSAVVHYEQAIYEGGPGEILQLIANIANNGNTVLLVGHNPGMEELVRLLTDRSETISTCTLAKITFATGELTQLAPGTGVLEQLVRP